MSRRTAAGPAGPLQVVERIRAVEVPVLTETKRRLGRGEVGAALRYAYPQVVADLQRAYRHPFAVGWTHEEILRFGFHPEMEPLREFFEALWRLYEPFRYGDRAPPPDGRQVLELLLSLYAAEPMWRLYLAPARAGGAHPPTPAVAVRTETETVG